VRVDELDLTAHQREVPDQLVLCDRFRDLSKLLELRIREHLRRHEPPRRPQTTTITDRAGPPARAVPTATGAFYRSAMYPLLSRINAYLVRWIRKKYKRLRAKRKAFRCLHGIVERFPRMFAHWEWVVSAPGVW
jgi:hypothetical protein